MATCKDCFHFEVCDSGRHIGEYIKDDSIYSDGVEKECEAFKDNTDVVKVCCCKECENGYRKSFISVMCKIWNRVMIAEDYCSYGAKMDGVPQKEG